MSRQSDVSNTDDVFDIRDVIEEFEELDGAESLDESDKERHTLLKSFLDDMQGNGGDEQWRGHWYPVTFVRDSYWKDFAQEEAESLDLVKPDVSWPYTCIDWDRAASELQIDYSAAEFDGVTYWYR